MLSTDNKNMQLDIFSCHNGQSCCLLQLQSHVLKIFYFIWELWIKDLNSAENNLSLANFLFGINACLSFVRILWYDKDVLHFIHLQVISQHFYTFFFLQKWPKTSKQNAFYGDEYEKSVFFSLSLFCERMKYTLSEC